MLTLGKCSSSTGVFFLSQSGQLRHTFVPSSNEISLPLPQPEVLELERVGETLEMVLGMVSGFGLTWDEASATVWLRRLLLCLTCFAPNFSTFSLLQWLWWWSLLIDASILAESGFDVSTMLIRALVTLSSMCFAYM